MNRSRTSIAHRLLIGLTAIIGTSSALVVALLTVYETRGSRSAMENGLDASAAAFARMVEPALWDVDTVRTALIATAFARDPRIARLSVRDGGSGREQIFDRVATADTAMRTASVVRDGQVLGTVSVVFDRGFYRSQVMRQVTTAAVVSLIALVAALLSLQLVFRRAFSKPLGELADVVRGFAQRKPRTPETSIAYAEFEPFVGVLDAMSAQIRAQLTALSEANRELKALNHFLVIAAGDRKPAILVKEAARELRELFRASWVRAYVESERRIRETVLVDPEGAATDGITHELPIIVNGQAAGAIILGREAGRPFTTAELELATAVGAQLAGAISRWRARGGERLLRAAIEQLPESVVVTDNELRIVYVNPAFTTMSGYTADEAIGRTPRSLKGQDDKEASERARAVLSSGDTFIGRLKARNKAGELYFEDMVITPVRNDEGVATHSVAISRDVTREIQREEQYRHAQRLEAVGQLAGGIAHDFNNMLGAVLMQLDLLELDAEPQSPLASAVREMRGSIERAANLTRQLLMFSRRQAMRLHAHDLNELVDEILRMMRRVIGERAQVTFERAEDAVMFEGDAGMIEQVLVNLCLNARDAMPNGGVLAISTREVVRGEDDPHPGRWACVEVRDTGTGMSDEVRERIFEPFFTTKAVGQGTGLGLATTHGIVSQHGGWIDVETQLGVGTSMCVYLPWLTNAIPSVTGEHRGIVASEVGTVLVVEDEPAMREIVSRGLVELGHRVVEATNGAMALELWRRHREDIDLVLTDMVMPEGVSGLSLVETLRKDEPGIPAIVMSGYSLQLVSESMSHDVVFLAKPFSLASLAAAIGDSLRTS